MQMCPEPQQAQGTEPSPAEPYLLAPSHCQDLVNKQGPESKVQAAGGLRAAVPPRLGPRKAVQVEVPICRRSGIGGGIGLGSEKGKEKIAHVQAQWKERTCYLKKQ